MENRFFAMAAITAAMALGLPGAAHGQLFGGSGLLGTGLGSGLGSGLLGAGSGNGSTLLSGTPLGGTSLGNPLSLLTPSGNPISAVSGLLNNVTGTVGSLLNTTQSALSTTTGNVSAMTGVTSSLLSGVGLTGASLDTSSLLSRFDAIGLPSPDSVYSFGADSLVALPGAGGGNNLGSAFFFGWSPSGYVPALANPVLRSPGASGSLVPPASTDGAIRISKGTH